MTLQPHPCPVCDHAPPHELLREQCFDSLPGALLDGYDVVCCQGCGFVFADRLPGPEAFAAYYAGMSKYEGPEDPLDAQRLAETAGVIVGWMPQCSGRVVEVGCAGGLLLAALRARGFLDVRGVDPSRACAESAWSRHQVRVDVGTFAAWPSDVPLADLLVLVGVVEHLRDPVRTLRAAAQHLSPGGRLFLEMPDASQFAASDNAPYQQFSMEHIAYFDANSLENLLAAAGFAVEGIRAGVAQVAGGLCEPVLRAIARVGEARIRPSATAREAMVSYLAASVRRDAALRERLATFANQGEFYVWGTGTHTLRLLRETNLAQMPIRAFIDRNPHYQGKALAGRRIVGPEAIESGWPVLVSSYAFEAEIASWIRQERGAANPVWTLYGR